MKRNSLGHDMTAEARVDSEPFLDNINDAIKAVTYSGINGVTHTEPGRINTF